MKKVKMMMMIMNMTVAGSRIITNEMTDDTRNNDSVGPGN